MLTLFQNVDKAKKEIEKLEAEEAAGQSGTNGDKKVDGVASDLKETSLEDKE